jgi:hypothetical protein
MYPGSIAYAMPGVASSTSSFPDIEFIGAEENVGATVTIPAGHQAGDLMVMWTWQDTGGTPAAPGGGGWTVKTAASRTGFAGKNYRVYSKPCTSGSETSGTWTSCDALHCHVYRNASGLGSGAIANDGASNPDIPALSLTVTDGSSWVAAFALEVGTTNDMSPSGMSERSAVSSLGDYRAETWDTNAGVASFAGKTNIASSGTHDWASSAVEVLKATS